MTDTTTLPAPASLSQMRVRAIRRRSDGLFASLDDAGEISFEPLRAETLLYTDYGDNEALYAAMSACPGGHETVEEYELLLSLEPA